MEKNSTERIFNEIKEIRITAANSHSSYERRWIKNQIRDADLKSKVDGISIVALHVLSKLEEKEKTGVEIAQEISVTRGGVTRAAQKLLQKGLIKAGKKQDNQKKIYYRLTEEGQEVAKAHDQLHQMIKKKIIIKLSQKYSHQELQLIANFLQDFITSEKNIL